MLNLKPETKVYLFSAPTDMRKGFDRLAELAKEHAGQSPLSGALFVFLSRRRDRVKILFWDKDGYVLFYKRLEAGTFRVEEKEGCEEITGVDLELLLAGMSLRRIKLRKKVSSGVFSTREM